MENTAQKRLQNKGPEHAGLHQHIIRAWDEFDQLVINAVISRWPTQLGAFVVAEGGHFEYTVKNSIYNH